MPRPALKSKKCRQCGEDFHPSGGMQVACSLVCALEQSREKQQRSADKMARERLRLGRDALKTRSEYVKEAAVSVHKYIRARDKGKPCISCGVYEQERFTGGHFDAGHYRSTGAAPHMRFNLLNIFGQCKRCNRNLSGNTVEMRKGVIQRIGIDLVESIECDNGIVRFDIPYLKRMKRIFNKRARYYLKRRG